MIGDFSGSKIIDYIGSNFTTFSLRFPLNPENNAFRAHIRVERTKYQRRNGKLVRLPEMHSENTQEKDSGVSQEKDRI